MFLKPGFGSGVRTPPCSHLARIEKLLSENGVYDYSIYWDRDTNILFARQKTRGGESSQEMGSNPIVQKWWDYTADIMEVNPDNSPVTIPCPKSSTWINQPNRMKRFRSSCSSSRHAAFAPTSSSGSTAHTPSPTPHSATPHRSSVWRFDLFRSDLRQVTGFEPIAAPASESHDPHRWNSNKASAAVRNALKNRRARR